MRGRIDGGGTVRVLSLRSGHTPIRGTRLVRSNIDERETERTVLQIEVIKTTTYSLDLH